MYPCPARLFPPRSDGHGVWRYGSWGYWGPAGAPLLAAQAYRWVLWKQQLLALLFHSCRCPDTTRGLRWGAGPTCLRPLVQGQVLCSVTRWQSLWWPQSSLSTAAQHSGVALFSDAHTKQPRPPSHSPQPGNLPKISRRWFRGF